MTESNRYLTPEEAAELMRVYLPEGPHPGAPGTGAALLARSRRNIAPDRILKTGRARGRWVYTRPAVMAFCLDVMPPRVRAAVTEVPRLAAMDEKVKQLIAENDFSPDDGSKEAFRAGAAMGILRQIMAAREEMEDAGQPGPVLEMSAEVRQALAMRAEAESLVDSPMDNIDASTVVEHLLAVEP